MVVTRDTNGDIDLFIPPSLDIKTEYIMVVADVATTDHKFPKHIIKPCFLLIVMSE